MVEFQRIYFDTNVAIKEGWPRVSAAFDQMLGLAELFKVPVTLLNSVEYELEEHWIREYMESRETVEEFGDFHERVDLNVELRLPSLDKIRGAYRAVVEAAVTQHHILRAEPEVRPTLEFFKMAVLGTKPFVKKGKGKNFQDAVIVLGAIDDLATSKIKSGAFLSRDGIFDQQSLNTLSESRKVTLTLFSDLSQLHDVLKKELGRELMRRWDADKEQARSALAEHENSIREYIAENVAIPADQNLFGGEILSVEGIESIKVKDIRTSLPWTRKKDQPVSFTAEVDVSFRAIVKPSFYTPFLVSKVVKVGGVASAPNPLLAPARSFEPREEIITRAVELEVSADVIDEKYSDLKFSSARLK